ncbi:MAG: cell division protein FtsL [Nitrospirota bacterium]
MNTRVSHIGSLVFEQSKRGNIRRVIAVLVIVACLMLYVAGKVNIVRLGYNIETLEKEKNELERENRALLIETSMLMSAARIEEIAIKRLGMVRPAKENIVVVRKTGKETTDGKNRSGKSGK